MADSADGKKSIGGRLRWARDQAGLSQGQVAQKLGVHRPTISQMEAGDRNVRIDEIHQLAELYGVNENWLMKGDEALAGERDPRIELAARELSKLKRDDLDSILRLIQVLRKQGEGKVSDKIALARRALRAAMQLRRSLSIPREAAVNAFDIAKMVGLDVRFLDAPSLEGMFVRDPGPQILLPSTKHRPKARILFSCGHEVGHQQFGHGTKADRYWEDGRRHGGFEPDEYLVNAFASHLLMPRAAIMDSFGRRHWAADRPTPLQAFVIAGELGVGYGTLLTHLSVVLEVLPGERCEELQKVQPKAIKSSLVGETWADPLAIADEHWKNSPIDLETGELVVLPVGRGQGCSLLAHHTDHSATSIYKAERSGVSELKFAAGAVQLRVARRHYIGPYSNRYLDDPDEH